MFCLHQDQVWEIRGSWRRKWQPTPAFFPGESHGRRSLVGYSPPGRKESDTTEWVHFHFHFQEKSNIKKVKRSKRFGSVQVSHSVVSNSLRSHGLQYVRLPCPSPTPGAYSNSCLWVGDAMQSSHPPPSPSPPAFGIAKHQGLFQLVSSSHQVAKVLELHLQHQSFKWIFRTDFH